MNKYLFTKLFPRDKLTNSSSSDLLETIFVTSILCFWIAIGDDSHPDAPEVTCPFSSESGCCSLTISSSYNYVRINGRNSIFDKRLSYYIH